jgi:hypothetical protein
MDEYKEIPGGKFSVGCGILTAIAIMTATSLNFIAGLILFGIVGLLFFFTVKGFIGDRTLVAIFSTTFAVLPVMLLAYLILLGIISLFCCIILLFL